MKRLPIHVLILCNGDPPSRSLSRKAARSADLIIAADGGANIARQLQLSPDVILGDLDSISPATHRFFRSTPFLKIPRQDSTDLEKALTFAQQQGAARVTILGSTGKRIDFTLGNMAVLWNYARRMEITVAGDGWLAKPVVGHLDLAVRKGGIVSLIPFGPCSGITLKGLLYPLRNSSMKVGEIGVSNVAMRQRVGITVKRGKMLAVAFGRKFETRNPKYEGSTKTK